MSQPIGSSSAFPLFPIPQPSCLSEPRVSCCSELSASSRCNLKAGNTSEAPSGSTSGLPIFWPPNTTSMDPPNMEIKHAWRRGFFKGWRIVLFGSWLNVLLVLVPTAWIIGLTMPDAHGLVFAICMLALIPLVKLHDLATRDLASRIGGSKTGLLNASMSNVVEAVVAFSALRKCELRVVQSSLVGSMLSKLLLVLGLCFFAGGMRFSEQGFDVTATQINSSLLSISVGAVLLPAAYHFSLSGGKNKISDDQKQNILHMSHAVSIVLLFIYGSYLVFQLWSHTHLYKDHNKQSKRLSVKLPETPRLFRTKRQGTVTTPDGGNRMAGDPSPPHFSTPPCWPYLHSVSPMASTLNLAVTAEVVNEKQSVTSGPADSTITLVSRSEAPATSCDGPVATGFFSNDSRIGPGSSLPKEPWSMIDNRDLQPAAAIATPGDPLSTVHEPQLSWPLTLLILIILTAAVAFTADWLVESMDGISHAISKQWVGLILLPGVTAVAECMTAVNVSVKDQLTLSISVAVGSTIQTALFVIPFMVTLAWTMGKPLSLLMDPFESMVLYLSVQTMSYVVADGKSNWLEGVILICLYIIIAVSFWFYPGSILPDTLAMCTSQD